MDLLMTTEKPPCIPPYQVEEVRFIDSGKNRYNSFTTVLDRSSSKRILVSDLNTDITGIKSEVEFNNLKENIVKYRRVLHSFLELDNNWDGYNSSAPSNEVVEKSNQILTLLNDFEGMVNIVYPLENGVQVDFNTQFYKYEIEIYKDDVKLVKFDSEEEYLDTIYLDNITIFTLNDFII